MGILFGGAAYARPHAIDVAARREATMVEVSEEKETKSDFQNPVQEGRRGAAGGESMLLLLCTTVSIETHVVSMMCTHHCSQPQRTNRNDSAIHTGSSRVNELLQAAKRRPLRQGRLSLRQGRLSQTRQRHLGRVVTPRSVKADSLRQSPWVFALTNCTRSFPSGSARSS